MRFPSIPQTLFRALIAPLCRTPLQRQRVKTFWLGWAYVRLIVSPSVPRRMWLVRQFLRIDWNVLHSHSPAELCHIVLVASANRCGVPGTFIEAGCWNGGSSAKLSLICQLLGHPLHIYDSFQGVEAVAAEAGEWDFSGQYAASEQTVRENLARFGCPSLCTIHAGWFSDTMRDGVPGPVRFAFIDCDIAKGAADALRGILPNAAPGMIIFSQDYHIKPVRTLLNAAATWTGLGKSAPQIRRLTEKLAMATWSQPADEPTENVQAGRARSLELRSGRSGT